MDEATLLKELSRFTGSLDRLPLTETICCTPGVQFLCHTEHIWIFPYMIIALQSKRQLQDVPLQIWTLQQRGLVCRISCQDGYKDDRPRLISRRAEVSLSFLKEATIWLQDDVLFLPSEY